MKSYRGLIEDIKRTDQTTAERGGEIDPLTLAPGEGPRDAVEGQVPQSDVDEEPHPAAELIEQACANLHILLRQLESVQPVCQFAHRHLHKVADILASHLDIKRLFPQPSPLTVGTERPTPIARQHDPEVHLVLILSQEVKEVIDPPDSSSAMPEEVFLLLRQLVVRSVKGKSLRFRLGHKALLPARHLGSVPALDTPLPDGEGLVGYHQILIDPHHHAEALAGRAGTDGAIEAKELVRRLLEDDPIRLETVTE